MPHATRQKAFGRSANTPPRFRLFLTVTFIVLAGFQGAGAIADYWQIYILTEQTLMPLAVGALGTLCAFRRCELPHWTASAASFMLSGAALLYFLAFHFGQGDGVIAAAAGILMGGSCTLFFLLWEMFYVTEGQQRASSAFPFRRPCRWASTCSFASCPQSLWL